jgi:hypothetical protein
MSGMIVYADVEGGRGDPFALYRGGGVKGAGFRLAGEGCDDCLEGEGVALAGEGTALAGEGLGKGTRKKIVKAVKQHAPKVFRAGLGLAGEFGGPQQKLLAANALIAGRIVNGAGETGGCKGAGVALRKLMGNWFDGRVSDERGLDGEAYEDGGTSGVSTSNDEGGMRERELGCGGAR